MIARRSNGLTRPMPLLLTLRETRRPLAKPSAECESSARRTVRESSALSAAAAKSEKPLQFFLRLIAGAEMPGSPKQRQLIRMRGTKPFSTTSSMQRVALATSPKSCPARATPVFAGCASNSALLDLLDGRQ